MRNVRLNRIKVNGQWYWYEYKLAWNQRYYSFDAGQSWHTSKKEAWDLAKTKLPADCPIDLLQGAK